MKKTALVVVLASAAVFAGCAASARYVLIEPNGGTVATFRNTPELRAKALELVGQKCPAGYDIVREQEVTIGSEISNESRTELDRTFDEVRQTQSVRTRAKTEWRITFTCR